MIFIRESVAPLHTHIASPNGVTYGKGGKYNFKQSAIIRCETGKARPERESKGKSLKQAEIKQNPSDKYKE